MPRSQFREPEAQRPKFLDRVEALDAAAPHLDLLRTNPDYLHLIEILGLGGAGKTRFLAELRARALSEPRPPIVLWVDLEFAATGSPTGPLKALRDQLPFDCLLFDAALLSYWTATGQPFQLPSGTAMSRSVAVKGLETAGGGLLGVPLPLTFAADVYRACAKKVSLHRYYRPDEFKLIDGYRRDPSALLLRLPNYLGEDIRRRIRRDRRRLILFYDAYERQPLATIRDSSPWLREFIGTLDSGLHFIASREHIGWDDPDWVSVTTTIQIGPLPDRDCRILIRLAIPSAPRTLEDKLLIASGRIPFLLEALLESLQRHTPVGEASKEPTLPTGPREAMAELLDHLPDSQHTLVAAIATIGRVDYHLYLALCRGLRLNVRAPSWEDLTNLFLLQQLSSRPELFCVHRLLREYVLTAPRYESLRTEALAIATLRLLAQVSTAPSVDESLIAVYREILDGWASCQSVDGTSTSALVDIGYRFYDSGFWSQLTALSPGAPDGPKGHAATATANLFSAIATRRVRDIGTAIERLEPVQDVRAALGDRGNMVEIEMAYLSELAGNYTRARTEFERLHRLARPFDPSRRDHLRSRLYLADMLIMDGRFVKASRLLLEASELLGPRAPLDWAELVRHRAHAFRFSALFDNALALYQEATLVCGDAPALLAKLQTNIAESRCWSEPKAALDDISIAIELNQRLGNSIEVGKALIAKCIALARTGKVDSALAACGSGTRYFQEAGYLAGHAFALQGMAIAESLSGSPATAQTACDRLRATVTTIGTYAHLTVLPSLLLSKEDEPQLLAQYDWIDEEGVRERLLHPIGR